MTVRRIYIIIVLTVCCLPDNLAQEIVTGLKSNPDVRQKWENRVMLKSSPAPDTISLPFFDDFSGNDILPSPEFWTDSYVYINNTYPVNQVSQGVATFDAIDDTGLLYEEAGTEGFMADRLTSAPIDLDLDASENIYLSFFYQPQGIADDPEPNDSLVLQFYSPGAGEWIHIWKAEGTSLHNFKPVIIRIDDPDFLYRGFRFRFVNFASISASLSDPAMAGNSDHWNVDYIYLNRNRSASDTIPVDVAFTLPVRSVLNTYESMPWRQFREVFLSEMGSFIGINYRNNDEIIRNVTRNFVIRDIYNNTNVHSFSAGATNVDPGEWISYNANLIYTFNSANPDSALFRIRSILITDEFDRKVNDTIDYYQVFKNYFSYDDGSAESGYGINGQGASNAMVATRFRSFEPDTIRSVMISFNDSYLSSNRRYFNIAVWTDANGMPGDLIYEQEEMVDPGTRVNEFINYDLNDAVPVDGYFHVGWTQNSETFLNVGLDLNTLPEARRHFYINGDWRESEVEGSLMIRPVVGKAPVSSGIYDPELTNEIIKIWPNPVHDLLNIDVAPMRNLKYVEIEVYDNNGRKVLTSSNTSMLDVSSLPEGLYFLMIKAENRTVSLNRFIRMK